MPDRPASLLMDTPLQPLLAIKNLCTGFKNDRGITPALQDVSLTIAPASTVALVGESGSGKSLTALAIMRLIPPPGFIQSGEIVFDGIELTALSEARMRSIRGQRISMVFQEPMTSLNPVLRIGDQVTEPLIFHQGMARSTAIEVGTELLSRVGIPAASSRMRDYPHQLSGGMRQRVMIAMALACNPSLLIADEPTTALDTTIQAQILELLDSLRTSSALSTLLISHDLGVVAERSDHTCVMYAGRIVESASTGEIISRPLHPYTQGLLASLPQNATPGTPLKALPGQATAFAALSRGCGFCNRCPQSTDSCRNETPPLREVSSGHFVRCWIAS